MRFFFVIIIIVVVFIGCIPTQQITDLSTPRVLVQDPLPAFPESIKDIPLEISMALFITEDGSVTQVRLMKSSGSSSWDSLAITTIMRWQFVPANINDKPISAWFHLRAPIRYMKPLYVTLAEIVCSTRERIDSVYEALRQEKDFNELAVCYSIDPSRGNKGVIGEVNIFCYPEQIRRIVSDLEIDEFTEPIQYGDQYVIFKRLKK
jgi:TonB family protein